MGGQQSSAEGQYLGYSLQLSRLLELLLEGREGHSVTIEDVGDVSIESDRAVERVEELKSRTTASNPISNRAVDLWKTIRNWLDLIDDGVEPAETEFWLRTTSPYPSDFASRFDRVRDLEDARRLVSEVKATFNDNPPGETLAPFVSAVFLDRRSEQLAALLCSFHLSHGSGASAADLMKSLARTVVPEEHRRDVLNGLLGWVKLTTDTQLERRSTAAIRVSDLHRELVALVRKLDRQSVLQSYSLVPTGDEVESHRGRVFVRQIDIVEEEELTKIRAVRDYLRARADRIQWATRAILHTSDFDELEEDLEAAWRNLRSIIGLQDSERSEVDQGRLLLHRCLMHKCRIQGMDTPPYFTPGAFHAMADKEMIGWHPRYRDLLGTEEPEE